jgi:hypothetical protein
MLEISSTVMLSCLIYVWMERPMTNYLRGLIAHKPMQPVRPAPLQQQVS